MRSICDNVVDIRQNKALNYIYPRKKKISLFMPYMAFYVCVMFDLHDPKINAYLIERVVLFLYPSSLSIHSIQETSILERVIVEIFSSLLDTFPVPASYFLLI